MKKEFIFTIFVLAMSSSTFAGLETQDYSKILACNKKLNADDKDKLIKKCGGQLPVTPAPRTGAPKDNCNPPYDIRDGVEVPKPECKNHKSGAPKDNCNPPYVIRNGVEVPKPECSKSAKPDSKSTAPAPAPANVPVGKDAKGETTPTF